MKYLESLLLAVTVVAAIAVLLSADDTPEALDALMAEDLPVVNLGRREERPEVSYIAPDARAGAVLATQHLLELVEDQHHRLPGASLPPRPAVENVLDAAYRTHGSGINGPGRGFILSLRTLL